MMSTLKAEFRKIFSVRSTYIIMVLCLALVIFFAFFVEGIRSSPEALRDPNRLASEVNNAIMPISLILSLIGLLLFTHEYRYNTIMYTLTSSNSRTKVLLAKIISVSVVVAVLAVVFGALSPVLTYLGIHAKGHSLVHQVIPVGDLLWRNLFYAWGSAMAALLLAALIRIQVGAIVAIFLIPSTVEQLLGLLLKHNTVYLPYSSLGQVVQSGGEPRLGHLTPGKGAIVFGMYLVVGWIVAWVLFLRRDAN